MVKDSLTYQNTFLIIVPVPLIISNMMKIRKRTSPSATAESPLKVRKTTCNGKSIICSQDSQTIGSLRTLGQVSISSEKASAPFWSSRPKDWSQKLWLPTETDCAASLSNSWNGSFNSMESGSWFSMKAWTRALNQSSPKTSLPSLTFSIAESMVEESTLGREEKEKKVLEKRGSGLKKSKKPPANRSRKIRLYPSLEVVRCLKQWFGSVRKTYNWVLSTAQAEGFAPTNVPELRKRFVTAASIPDDFKYLLETPKHVRDGALDDLSIAFKTNFEKQKVNPDHKFQVAFRSKKESQSIVIPGPAVRMIMEDKELSMYPTYLKNKIRYHVRPRDARKGKDIREIQYDCRLLLDQEGHFYLCIPFRASARESQASERLEWCALDPGIRTFQTVYSPEYGVAYKLGDGDACRLHRLGRCLDKMIFRLSLRCGDTKRTRRRLVLAMTRMRKRIKNMVTEVHWKVINFLVTRFKNIVIPPFNVQDMVSKKHHARRISAVSVRKMLQWSHYTFRMRLMEKAVQHGCTVYVCGEEYTSKACTSCMQLHPNLGGAKVYKCPNCHVHYDRDLGGSRNIFLKNTLMCKSSIAPVT